jgi:hypothetical protein
MTFSIAICHRGERIIFDFETNTEKSGYLYLLTKLFCFVGEPIGRWNGESGEKSLVWPCKDFWRKSLKTILKRQDIREIFEPNIVFSYMNCSRGNNA